jgi:hypothetical protein
MGKSHTKHTLICKLINVETSVLLFTGMISVLWLKGVRVFNWQCAWWKGDTLDEEM